MASDLERSNDTVSGFFWLDTSVLTATQRTNWLTPGDMFYRVAYERNRNDSLPTAAQISAANTAWENFSRAVRYLIRMFHQCKIKRNLLTQWVLYGTFFPRAGATFLRNLNGADVRFLGQTFTSAKAAFGNDVEWLAMWPEGMDLRVLGYEADGE